MDGDLFTVILSSYFDTRYIFALSFQCHRFEVNQHPVAEVMPVLLRSGQSASWEEAAEFHKRVKRIHDPVKIVVPCAVVEVESPIPPDWSMQLSPYIRVLDDPLHAEASQRGLRFRDEVDKGPAEAISIDTDQIPSNDINKPASIDANPSPSIDSGRVSEQKEFNVCGNLRDVNTTMRSDKSWGKEEEELEEEKKDQGWSSGIIDPSLLRLCQKIQSAQQVLLTAICKASSTPYCLNDRQRRSVYGEGFHTRMIKLQRADLDTCFGACSHSHLDKIRYPKSS